SVRMKRHCNNASKIAEFLEAHSKVERVYYPGLSSHPQYNLAKKQMRSPGGSVSFKIKGGHVESQKFINTLQLSILECSLVDPDTPIQQAAFITHQCNPSTE